MKKHDLAEQIPETGKFEVRFTFQSKRKCGTKKNPTPTNIKPGTIPRVTRLMALAIKFDGMLARGEVRDYADLARLGYVSRARITQIMNLLTLAPEIQEKILFLHRTIKGHDPIREQNLRPIAGEPDWREQRRLWRKLALLVS